MRYGTPALARQLTADATSKVHNDKSSVSSQITAPKASSPKLPRAAPAASRAPPLCRAARQIHAALASDVPSGRVSPPHCFVNINI
jgi:hypothetical protein